jgi:hypothetical protein
MFSSLSPALSAMPCTGVGFLLVLLVFSHVSHVQISVSVRPGGKSFFLLLSGNFPFVYVRLSMTQRGKLFYLRLQAILDNKLPLLV